LYNSGDLGYSLPREKFPEFDSRTLTWKGFRNEVENREINRLNAAISVVQTFEGKTMKAMDLFKQQVMDANFKAEDADIVLTTCHAAKGMEWDNVVVCEDLYHLPKVNPNGPAILDPKTKTKRTSWQFELKSYGDDVNLLYVACTRAKKLLSIPSSIKSLLQDCDTLHDVVRVKMLYKEKDDQKDTMMCLFGMEKTLNVSDALNLYQDLVLPLRQQCSVHPKERLMGTLVSPLEGDVYQSAEDCKVMDGDSDFEAYFQMATTIPPPLAAAAKPFARIYQVLEEAKRAAALVPKGLSRPYDKIDTAPTGKAKCRACSQFIAQGAKRVGIQVYKPDKSQFWASYFHDNSTCCPTDARKLLRLDPNPPKVGASKRKASWSAGEGGYKKKGGQWQSRGYKKRRY
jgi:hypothetical protein